MGGDRLSNLQLGDHITSWDTMKYDIVSLYLQ